MAAYERGNGGRSEKKNILFIHSECIIIVVIKEVQVSCEGDKERDSDTVP